MCLNAKLNILMIIIGSNMGSAERCSSIIETTYKKILCSILFIFRLKKGCRFVKLINLLMTLSDSQTNNYSIYRDTKNVHGLTTG